MRKSRFWFHYNKPASRKFGKPKLTLHYKNTCHLVDNIKCHVYTESFHRKTQPHVVIRGHSLVMQFNKGLDGNITVIIF